MTTVKWAPLSATLAPLVTTLAPLGPLLHSSSDVLTSSQRRASCPRPLRHRTGDP